MKLLTEVQKQISPLERPGYVLDAYEDSTRKYIYIRLRLEFIDLGRVLCCISKQFLRDAKLSGYIEKRVSEMYKTMDKTMEGKPCRK